MTDDLLRKLEAEKERDLPIPARFVAFSLEMVLARYSWGGENLLGSDCSGTVCLPLMRCGFRVRVRAQDLFDKYFTRSAAGATEWSTRIMAVFYGTDERHIIHVTPVVGIDCVVNAHQRKNIVELRTVMAVQSMYNATGCRHWWREADMDALAAADDIQGLDQVLA